MADRIRLPFAEQIAFFRNKLNLPTEWWDDLQGAAHDRAFVVAGAMAADLIDDLRRAVDAAITAAETLAEFRARFTELVNRHGWTDWTGEGSRGGWAWRTRTIYNTNVYTSYQAGRWRQLRHPELLARRPYWRYVHSGLAREPRPLHEQWGDTGLTLPADHPFWQTHFPPNGWGCRCRVVAVRAPVDGDATEPPEGWDEIIPETGAPPGIDKGWAYAPGASADRALRELVADKLAGYPPELRRQVQEDLGPRLSG